MRELNGENFFYKILAGLNRVIREEKHLNDINFFPVPDGDTGTNLALTSSSIMQNCRPHQSLSLTSRAIADAAFRGARGNAGLIMAQYLKGLSDSFTGKVAVNVRDYSAAVKKAVSVTYNSVINPVEGTILTVMRHWSECLNSLIDEVDDFKKLFTGSLKSAQEALSGTMNRIKVLQKNRVVDAGGKGFVLFLQGILDFLEKGHRIDPLEYHPPEPSGDHHPDILPENISHRFCSQLVLDRPRLDRGSLIARLRELGDSLIIGGDADRFKIHIHTNHPDLLTEELMEEGDIQDPVVDDMLLQSLSRQEKRPVALVTDSACDLPRKLMDEYRIHLVPITIFHRSHTFLDKLTLRPSTLYRMLDSYRDAPVSSQPNVQTFENLYRSLLPRYRRIVSFHLSAALSGTFNSARLAAENVDPSRITVVDSTSISTALGLQVLRIARAIRDRQSWPSLEQQLRHLPGRGVIYVSVRNLKYMVRGGRVSPLKGLLARILNLTPIISLDREGKSCLIGKAFGFDANLRKMKSMVLEKAREPGILEYAIGHVNNPQTARSLGEDLQRMIGKKPVYITDVSPLIGMHAGPGSVSVSLVENPG